MSLGGAWSTRGINMIESHHDNVTNDTYYTCLTNHLTNFAILMETSEYEVKECSHNEPVKIKNHYCNALLELRTLATRLILA